MARLALLRRSIKPTKRIRWSRPHRWAGLAALLLALVAFAQGKLALAQSAEELAALMHRIDEHEAELRQLRAEVAQSARPIRLPAVDAPSPILADAPQYPEQPASFLLQSGDPGLRRSEADPKKPTDGWTDLSNEKWTVKLGGHVQADLVQWAHRDPDITSPLARNYFEFRRLRLVADGTGYGVYDFRLQLTLEPELVNETLGTTAPAVKDAYFSINETPLGRWRIGNFFVPFSLEQVTNDTNTVFLERSIPSQGVFAADREPGIAMYDHTDDLSVTWYTGVFIDNISDAVQERIDNNLGVRVVGRATWCPIYDEPSNGRYVLYTGAGVMYTDDHDDRIRFRARPQVHEGPFLIDSGSLVGKTYTVGNVEFATVVGPFCLQSEAFVGDVNLDAGPATIYGMYAYATYCLTGENRNFERFGQHGAQFGRFTPWNNVFWVPGGCGWGAWEVKARYSNLTLAQLNAGQYNDFTFGFNWYWSDRVRCLFDWIHPFTSAQTVFGDTSSDLIAMRFDFNW